MLSGKYVDVRPSIKDGDVVFVKGNSITGRVIRLATGSEYSHVGIAFWMKVGNENDLMIVEAQGRTNRRMVNLSFYAKTDCDVVAAPRPWTEYENEALKDLGIVKYSWSDAIYIGLSVLVSRFIGIKLPFIDFDGEICSEFVGQFVGMSKHESPEGLYRALLAKGHEVTVQIKK